MRNSFLLLAFLFAGNVAAQDYMQKAMPAQQTLPQTDCYTQNLDNGNAALRRGEPREALRFFNAAKNCPDAQGNTRRQAELETRISRCEEQMGLRNPSTPTETKTINLPPAPTRKRSFALTDANVTRRNYSANRDFLKDTLDDCFLRMVEEADRAYRLRFWEDAAALYRAAKNCSDADQKARQNMSDRIIACRNAAENELFAKQQEAERQARHAIAANLANTAKDLLKSTDRTIAYRLADFANQYIAPDDNAECVQAIFDAWYYQSPEDARNRLDQLYNPVFCYELGENLGENAQIRFQQQPNGAQWLWAYSPKTGRLKAWELPTMKEMLAYNVGDAKLYSGFDISPKGVLVLWGKTFFEFRQGNDTYRVDLSQVANWCFDARGDEFFYENKTDDKIYALNLREAFAQQYARKGNKGSNILQAPLNREFVTGATEGLMAMEYRRGKFWLGYPDRIEVLGKAEPGKPWKRERVIPFREVSIPAHVRALDLSLKIFPEQEFAVLGHHYETWSIPLSDQTDNEGLARYHPYTSMIAVSGDKHQIACKNNTQFYFEGFWILDAITGDTLHRQRMPAYQSYGLLPGSYSADGRWVAAVSLNGNLNIWHLQDAPTFWRQPIPGPFETEPFFSPNGNLVFLNHADSTTVLHTVGSKDADLFVKNHKTSLRGASDHWAMYQISADSAEARHLATGRKLRLPLPNDGVPYPYAFDPKGEQYVAYLTDWSEMELRSLSTGALLTKKTFEGGTLSDLHFIPNTNTLLIVQQQYNTGGSVLYGHSSVKIWAPLGNEKPRALRLHQYSVKKVALNVESPHAAFTDGRDIRIFDLRNLENEETKIRSVGEEYVQSIAFRPKSNMLAAAYSSGKVIFWNTRSGQQALHLQVISAEESFNEMVQIEAIGFSHNGNLLHVVQNDGQLVSYALDPMYIRDVAQDDKRNLQSFDESYILQNNLEAALYYPGNFERLAESGDAPLLRSFFHYFRNQSFESNNIEQVRGYCERAFYLFERLDQNTQEIWEGEMRMIYEDYTWKLLLRNNLKEASDIIRFIKSRFGYTPVLLEAHEALLRKSCSNASRLYSDYFLNAFNAPYGESDIQWELEHVEEDMIQLRNYELIDSTQNACFCGILRWSKAFSEFCPLGDQYPSSYLSADDIARWEVFEKRRSAYENQRFDQKTVLLEDALQLSTQLARRNPSAGKLWLERSTLGLARAYQAWGGFEQNSPAALPHFERAAQLLSTAEPFSATPDTSRLSLLCSIRLAWGKFLLDAGKPAQAIEQLNLGLEAAQPLSEIVFDADTSLLRIYYDNIVGPLYQHLGTAFLLTGDAQRARTAYERAGTYYVSRGLNPLYLANVAVFENNETEAFLEYGSIFYPHETAQAIFELERMAERFPAERARITDFVQRLRGGLRSKSQRMVGAESEYWLAVFKKTHFAAIGNWDSTVVWSERELQYAKRSMDAPYSDPQWVNRWLDQHVDLPYFLLLAQWNKPAALDRCIQLVETALQYLADNRTHFYPNRQLLYTNYAHALLLRNKPGDREKAISHYQKFIREHGDPRGYDNLEMLEKDFRDLRRAGASIPDLPELKQVEEMMEENR